MFTWSNARCLKHVFLEQMATPRVQTYWSSKRRKIPAFSIQIGKELRIWNKYCEHNSIYCKKARNLKYQNVLTKFAEFAELLRLERANCANNVDLEQSYKMNVHLLVQKSALVQTRTSPPLNTGNENCLSNDYCSLLTAQRWSQHIGGAFGRGCPVLKLKSCLQNHLLRRVSAFKVLYLDTNFIQSVASRNAPCRCDINLTITYNYYYSANYKARRTKLKSPIYLPLSKHVITWKKKSS